MNKLRLFITKAYLKVLGKKIKNIQTFKISTNKNIKIIVYKDKKSRPSAQALPGMSIIASESIFNNYSKNVQKFILTHEYGHKQLNKFLRILATSFLIFFGLITSFSVLNIIFILITTIRNAYLINIIIIQLKIALIFLFLFTTLSWIIEFHADWYSINRIGIKNIEQAYKEIKKKKEKTKILNYFTHPPLKWSINIYKFRNKFKK